MDKPVFIYQINGKEWEVIREDSNGFSWICDCGHIGNPKSEKNAIMIVKSLVEGVKNGTIK